MTDTNLPLDEAAEWDTLYKARRAALTLRARVAELEAERNKLRELFEASEGLRHENHERAVRYAARVNRLRDPLEQTPCFSRASENSGDPCFLSHIGETCIRCAALASTPAADLAAYRKSVMEDDGRKLALQVAGAVWAMIAPAEPMDSAACVAIVERALAAQEVTK